MNSIINYTEYANGSELNYKIYNLRGDVIKTVKADKSTKSFSHYYAFGNHDDVYGSTPTDDFRANTKVEDDENLLNEGKRFRHLEFGIFLTPDPLEYIDGPNPYIYCNQNPWGKWDPLGLRSWNAALYDNENLGIELAQNVAKTVKSPETVVKDLANIAIIQSKAFVDSINVSVELGAKIGVEFKITEQVVLSLKAGSALEYTINLSTKDKKEILNSSAKASLSFFDMLNVKASTSNKSGILTNNSYPKNFIIDETSIDYGITFFNDKIIENKENKDTDNLPITRSQKRDFKARKDATISNDIEVKISAGVGIGFGIDFNRYNKSLEELYKKRD